MSGPVLYVMSSTIAKELSREQVCSDFGDEMIKAHNGVHFQMRFDGARLRLTDVSKFLERHPEARTLMIRKLIKHYDELHKKFFAVFNITAREVEADIHHESKLFDEIVNFKRQDLLNEYGDVKLVFRIHGEDQESWTVREFFESPEEESDLVEPNILESLFRNPNHPALKDEDGMLLFEHPAEQTRAAAENNDDDEGEEGENEEDQDETMEDEMMEEEMEEDEMEEDENEEEEEEEDDEEEQAGPAQAPRRRTAGARGPTTSTVCFVPGCTTQTLRANPRNTDIITHLIQAHGLQITSAMRSHGGNELSKRMQRNRIARPWLRQRGVDPNTVKPFEDPTGDTDEEDE
ncbi:hypothetical protein KC340_g2588 [Hortaea werneckii]|nr:hypothetical protein KC342_g2550 [Hortaea werneckii]KAI7104420.1 hypothetical protein KC339_g4545 [Hortaea werneckii]KAI7245192.1 hypothetical protein KC365_g686 [Hortaea werneckii]KAI7334189.1 hypothetical protein KC340_g2588 [Hortaea werneckii]KAI7403872.1 hypothetical protein KC328_g2151 [Hortaea werneckii]